MAQNRSVEPVEPLSARALGSYLYMLGKGSYATAEELAGVFSEGKAAFRSALKELRDHGLVVTKKIRLASGQIVTTSRIVIPPKSENRKPEIGPLTQLNIYKTINSINNNFIQNNYSNKEIYSLKNRPAKAGTEDYKILNISIGGDMDEDYYKDLAREKELWRKESQEEFENKKRKSFNKDLAQGKNVPGSVAEFKRRVETIWHVKPWVQDTKDFRIAYSNSRRTHGTDGDLELRMMDLFFDSIKHNTEINDPDHLWRRFITMFGSLATQVRNTVVNDDKVNKEEERVAKSMEKLFDV